MSQRIKTVSAFHVRVQRAARCLGALACLASTALGCGLSDDLDTGAGAPMASFQADRTSGGPGLVVSFSDTSRGTIDSRTWDFGPLGRQSVPNPVVQYAVPGTYPVTLTVVGPDGSSTAHEPTFITVATAPNAGVADFVADLTDGGPGLTVQFTNTSAGQLSSSSWDFGAAGTSTQTSPTIVFTDVGVYTVKLVVDGTAGSGEVEKVDFITVRPADEATSVSFVADPIEGPAGVVVNFTNTSKGVLTSSLWDFGAAGTSTDTHPTVSFAAAGTYTVSLEVEGTAGSGRLVKTDLIHVYDPPAAAMSCSPAVTFVEDVFGNNAVTCSDASTSATDALWDFGDGTSCYYPAGSSFATSPGATLCASASPSHAYDTPGTYDIELTVSNAAGTSTTSQSIDVVEPVITINKPSGLPVPVDAILTFDAMGAATTTYAWSIDGVGIAQLTASVPYRFKTPGVYTISVTAFSLAGLAATLERTFEVVHGPPVADFSPGRIGGFGPLDVQFSDASSGSLTSWEWDFGDGESCLFPHDPMAPAGTVTCTSSSPLHTYVETGQYDVSLTVEGLETETGTSTIASSITKAKVVTVFIGDPGFEQQNAGQEIGAPWTHLTPSGATDRASHIALSSLSSTPLVSVPSDGLKQWAVLDGEFTDGSQSVENVDNGIQQDFFFPPGRSVLLFDYALLYAEPPDGGRPDAIIATVSDGVTTHVIDSSYADTATPYLGQSKLYPTRDGSLVRSTPLFTASVNLQDTAFFPTSDENTRFTLTIRIANSGNGARSPRAFVDGVRFAAPVDPALLPLPVSFSFDSVAYTGQPVTFDFDDSCAAPGATCLSPDNFRWDFDTQHSLNPPASSGSDEMSPTYVFEETGVYTVSLDAGLADARSTATATVTVLENLSADFTVSPDQGPYVAPAVIDFSDASTADPSDPIVAWDWDFVFGTDTGPNPQFVFQYAGTFVVRLTVTTQSGATASHDLAIVIEAP